MPTELGQPFAPTYTGLPTRMSGEDLLIWRRFQPRFAHRWERLYFDVHLGSGRQNIETPDRHWRAFWMRETQKRADVLAELSEELWLIELRDAAQLNAVGRLLGYVDLWADDPVIPKRLVPMLVTNSRDRDVERLSEKSGILYLAL